MFTAEGYMLQQHIVKVSLHVVGRVEVCVAHDRMHAFRQREHMVAVCVQAHALQRHPLAMQHHFVLADGACLVLPEVLSKSDVLQAPRAAAVQVYGGRLCAAAPACVHCPLPHAASMRERAVGGVLATYKTSGMVTMLMPMQYNAASQGLTGWDRTMAETSCSSDLDKSCRPSLRAAASSITSRPDGSCFSAYFSSAYRRTRQSW
jgi:hypothetical protein